MEKSVLFILYLMISCPLNAQYNILQSKIEQTNELINQKKYAEAEKNAKIVISLSEQSNNKFGEAVGSMQLGQVRLYTDRLNEAIPFFEASTKLYFSKHNSPEAALAYNDLGYTYGKVGNLEKQLENLQIALRINEQLKPVDYSEIAVVLNNISTVYLELNQKDRAIEYAKKSLEYREKSGDVNKLALGYCNMCQMLRGTNSGELEKYRNLCMKFAEQSSDEDRLVQSYVTSALYFSDKKDLENAMNFEQKAIAILEQSGKNSTMLSRRYLALAMHAVSLKKDSTEILNYLEKSKYLAEKNQDKYTLREINAQYYLLHKSKGNFEQALEDYRTFIKYKDSIITENTQSNIAELETKYQSEKKDNQIQQLSADQKIKQLQIEKQSAELVGNKLLAAQKEKEIQLLSQEKELQNLRISQQNKELEKRKLIALADKQQLQLAVQEKIIQDKKLKNSKAVQYLTFGLIGLFSALTFFLFNRYHLKRTIREQQKLLSVRESIAKDLHDEIGSTLTGIKILSEVSDKNLNSNQNKVSAFLRQITEQSSMAQQGISDIVWSIKPENDLLENMVTRMREYIAHTLEHKNIDTHISIDEILLSKSLDMQQRRDILLIFKEAVNNIAKYAEASQVAVLLEKANNKLRLKIQDNGKGFDTKSTRNGNGLHNMKNRASSLNATLEVHSALNKGTVITLLMPTT